MSSLDSAFNGLPRKFLPEWISISRERDPEIRASSLYQLASRLEGDDHPKAAAEIYSAIAQGQGERSPDVPLEIRRRAQERLRVLEGKGPFGLTFEAWAPRFFHGKNLLPNLFGLGFAQVLARSTGAFSFGAALARMSVTRSAGVGAARVIAGSAALFVEGPALVLGTHAAGSLLGQEGFAQAELSREIQGAWMWLGAMRLAGYAMPAALPGLRPVGMFAGVLLGQGLEAQAGLREFSGAAEFVREGIFSFLHAKVMGEIAGGFLGGRFPRLEAQLELAARRRAAEGGRKWTGTETLPATQAALGSVGGQAALFPGRAVAPLFGEAIYRIQPSEPPPASTTRPNATPLASNHFFLPLSAPARESLEGIQRELTGNEELAPLLSQTAAIIPDPSRLDPMLARLAHIAKSSHPEGAQGSYFNWLSRIWLREILEGGSSGRLATMLNLLYAGGTLSKFEVQLGMDIAELQMRLPPEFPATVRRRWDAEYSQLNAALSSCSVAVDLLQRYLGSEKPYLIPEPLWREPSAVLDGIQAYFSQPEQFPGLEAILKAALNSPTPILRLLRLGRVLEEKGLLLISKLEELADQNFSVRGVNQRFPELSLEKMRQTQYDAYLPHSLSLEALHDLHRRSAELLDPESAGRRARARQAQLADKVETLNSYDQLSAGIFASLFDILGDPLSRGIAEALAAPESAREFEFHFVAKGSEEEALLKQTSQWKGWDGNGHFGHYLYPGQGRSRGVMLVRKPSAGHPSEMSVFGLLRTIFHELEVHHRVKSELERIPRSAPVAFINELTAHAREGVWSAEHGDIGDLQKSHLEGPAGFALYFRDLYERDYFPR